MALNSNALTTVERVAAVIKTYPFLAPGITFDDVDVIEELARIINGWSEYIQTEIQAQLGLKTYTDFYKGTNHPSLVLKHYPVKEIVSIEQVDGKGNVLSAVDVEEMMQFISEDDLRKGILYLEPNFVQRFSTIGIVPELFNSLRSYKIVYKAGYTLPQNATEEVPTDLPSDIENLLIDLAKAEFINNTDPLRANNLITLTEGNVQRMWAEPKEFKLTTSQSRILSRYRRKSV